MEQMLRVVKRVEVLWCIVGVCPAVSQALLAWTHVALALAPSVPVVFGLSLSVVLLVCQGLDMMVFALVAQSSMGKFPLTPL